LDVIVDGYVRVSQMGGRSGESFLSPTLQREQIEGWAKRHGALIDVVFEELDVSGARRDRQKLLAAIERVERGESDDLVVAYASRFGRSQLDGLLAIDRIVRAGGVFVSASEGLDYSTDMGRHMLRTMLSWAEWELDRVRANWRVANERAVRRGVFVGGVPFGYQCGNDGRLRIHPVRGTVVAELFRRRAEGARVVELRRWLIDDGVRTSRGDVGWHTSTLAKKLENRSYLGEASYGGVVNRCAHAPLTDPETWELAQFPGVRTPPRGFPPAPLLWGMVRCSNCGRPLGHSRAFQALASTRAGTGAGVTPQLSHAEQQPTLATRRSSRTWKPCLARATQGRAAPQVGPGRKGSRRPSSDASASSMPTVTTNVFRSRLGRTGSLMA
jgi:site-specific DNA recombinase